jgi:hypothetical protein
MGFSAWGLGQAPKWRRPFARLAVENDWGLFRLCPEHTTLEDVFVELTREEAATDPPEQDG